MMKSRILILVFLVAVSLGLQAQTVSDVLGSHDLTLANSKLSACQYCHATHSARNGVKYLWSQQLSSAQYTLFQDTLNPTAQPVLGSDSNLCLSCHDGTVAVGTTMPYGTISNPKALDSQDNFGNDLSTIHPFNFQKKLDPSTPNMLQAVIDGTGTGDSAVKLIDGNIQCTTCHEPHNQFLDQSTAMFLVVDNTNSKLCLACHTTTPASSSVQMATSRQRTMATSEARGVSVSNGLPPLRNSLESWRESSHAVSTHRVARGSKLGKYTLVSRNGCGSCHAAHNGSGRNLLTQPSPAVANMDAATQNCMVCHNGSSTLTPALPSVYSELAKTGHPLPSGSNLHDSKEDAVLKSNRHATCVDCHNPHGASNDTSFATLGLRNSQRGATGISAKDGVTKLPTASNQYETCLRCHGTSDGKQRLQQFGYAPIRVAASSDPLNLIPQFSTSAVSKHPVMTDRSSAYPQPSLLESIWNLDGLTPGRQMGTRILCSDCHNSDDNREFGGNGPNGPHGSVYSHILERRYEMSQVVTGAGPGTPIQNLFPNPSLSPICASNPCASPYALCAKCHDLTKVVANTSFNQHGRHINAGISCSVCHTAHGSGAASAGVTGERLVNFDLNVVAQNGAAPISYNRATNTCTLTCHNVAHSANGSVGVGSSQLKVSNTR